MTYEAALEYLLRCGAANIRYRVRRDILGEKPDTPSMQALHQDILALPKVKKVFDSFAQDGKTGRNLHGVYFQAYDSNVMFLLLNGVEITHPRLASAREALLCWRDFERDGFYPAGSAMDEAHRGGFRAILADILLDLGCPEDTPLIREQIGTALLSFEAALRYGSIDDFTKKCTVRKNPARCYTGAYFPSGTHVKMLSRTKSWRTPENLTMVERSFAHCARLTAEYSGFLWLKYDGHFVGPFNADFRGSAPESIREFDRHPIDFAWWMRGCHFAHQYLIRPAGPAAALTEWLAQDDILDGLPDEYLRMFRRYASLEPSWRKTESVRCDLLLPILLALHAGREA